MASEDEVGVFLDKIGKLYDRFLINGAVIELWLNAFMYCKPEILNKSLQRWVETSQKTPTLYDIKSIALALSGGSFYQKKDEEELLAYNDPETCKIIFQEKDCVISQRVARRFLQTNSNGTLFYPLAPGDHKVILES
jgi:hypothetical protein